MKVDRLSRVYCPAPVRMTRLALREDAMRRILKAVFLNAMLAIAGNDVRAQGVRLPSAFITGQALAGLPENARTQYVTGLVDGIFVAVAASFVQAAIPS